MKDLLQLRDISRFIVITQIQKLQKLQKFDFMISNKVHFFLPFSFYNIVHIAQLSLSVIRSVMSFLMQI